MWECVFFTLVCALEGPGVAGLLMSITATELSGTWCAKLREVFVVEFLRPWRMSALIFYWRLQVVSP